MEIIPFVGDAADGPGFVGVRRIGEQICVAVSLERDGDIEALLDADGAGRLIGALRSLTAPSPVDPSVAVLSRGDFVAFTTALAHEAELEGSTWENPTLTRFLESLAGWMDGLDGLRANRGEPLESEPSWQLMADMLRAATLNE